MAELALWGRILKQGVIVMMIDIGASSIVQMNLVIPV
jgi:hypothetical protein